MTFLIGILKQNALPFLVQSLIQINNFCCFLYEETGLEPLTLSPVPSPRNFWKLFEEIIRVTLDDQ